MKRRNFLKLFPIAGFAAVFGVKLKAEPTALNITQTPIRVDRKDFINFTSKSLGVPWQTSLEKRLEDEHKRTHKILYNLD